MTTTSNSHKFRFFVISLAFILIAGYSAFQAKNLILGPMLTIEYPAPGDTLQNDLVSIKGKAQNISHISLNDSPIYVDKSGSFEEKIILPAGYSVIKLSVTDRFGRTKTKLLEVSMLQEDKIDVYATVEPKEEVEKSSL